MFSGWLDFPIRGLAAKAPEQQEQVPATSREGLGMEMPLRAARATVTTGKQGLHVSGGLSGEGRAELSLGSRLRAQGQNSIRSQSA